MFSFKFEFLQFLPVFPLLFLFFIGFMFCFFFFFNLSFLRPFIVFVFVSLETLNEAYSERRAMFYILLWIIISLVLRQRKFILKVILYPDALPRISLKFSNAKTVWDRKMKLWHLKKNIISCSLGGRLTQYLTDLVYQGLI